MSMTKWPLADEFARRPRGELATYRHDTAITSFALPTPTAAADGQRRHAGHDTTAITPAALNCLLSEHSSPPPLMRDEQHIERACR